MLQKVLAWTRQMPCMFLPERGLLRKVSVRSPRGLHERWPKNVVPSNSSSIRLCKPFGVRILDVLGWCTQYKSLQVKPGAPAVERLLPKSQSCSPSNRLNLRRLRIHSLLPLPFEVLSFEVSSFEPLSFATFIVWAIPLEAFQQPVCRHDSLSQQNVIHSKSFYCLPPQRCQSRNRLNKDKQTTERDSPAAKSAKRRRFCSNFMNFISAITLCSSCLCK